MKFARASTLVGLLTAYGILAWLFLRFLEVDSCADAGGIFDASTSSCVSYRPGEFRELADRPAAFWVFAALVPAFPVTVAALLMRRRSKAQHA